MNKLKTNIKNDIDYSNCWKNPASFIDCIQETNIADAESKRSNKLCK